MFNRVDDGKTVVVDYQGQDVWGTVESSRVKYGGKVQYTVILDKPVQFPWRSESTTSVLITDDKIVAVIG